MSDFIVSSRLATFWTSRLSRTMIILQTMSKMRKMVRHIPIDFILMI